MNILLIILIILILGGGGWGFYGGWNRGSGSIFGLLVIILIVYLLLGHRSVYGAEPKISALHFRTPVPTLRQINYQFLLLPVIPEWPKNWVTA